MLNRQSLNTHPSHAAPLATMAVEIVACDASGAPTTARRVKVSDLLADLPKAPTPSPRRPQPHLG